MAVRDGNIGECPKGVLTTDYLSGVLDEAVAEQFEQHLAVCLACSVALSRLVDSGDQPSWLSIARSAGFVSQSGCGQSSDVTGELRQPLLPARYRVIRRLGQGGMGVVWEAWDEVLGRSVAVKVLPGATGTDHEYQRLLQEGAVLGRLNHPGIVRVIELVMTGGAPALVMELVSGPALSECLRDITVSDRDAALAVASLASASSMLTSTAWFIGI